MRLFGSKPKKVYPVYRIGEKVIVTNIEGRPDIKLPAVARITKYYGNVGYAIELEGHPVDFGVFAEDLHKFSETIPKVLAFIQGFKRFDTGEVTRTFTNGYCYWFASILNTRFPDSEIVYYAVGKHFACKIEDRIFDITGDITDKNLFFESWSSYKKEHPFEVKEILLSCIYKTGI